MTNGKRWVLALAAVLVCATFLAADVSAQGRAEIQAAQRQWAQEPTVNECVQTALRYFRLSPDEFDGYRSAARARGLVPTLAAGYRLDDDRLAFGRNEMPTPLIVDGSQNRRTHAVSAGLIFNLGDLVYNPAEVQIYGLIGVQRDIMLETTRTYFLRRQLLLRMATRPPEDPIAYAALELAIAEYTALLDVLTGGWFTEQIADRRRGRR
jgi:hypothetical protein